MTKDEMSSLAGQLLIAMPAMTDPRFAQSVIYMCAHSAEGALGIVVNAPLAQPTFGALLEQLKVEPVPPARVIRVLTGGPVEAARGFVLHSADWLGEGTLQVDEGVALSASLDVLAAIARGEGPREANLALGYAGWGPGQLDAEIQANGWLTAPAEAGILFDAQDATKWRRAIGLLGIDPLMLSSVAGRA